MRKNIDLENVEFASFPQRVAARLIDVLIVSFLFAFFITLSGLEIDENTSITGDLGLGIWIWFLPVLYLAYEIPGIASRGQTLGKRMTGILIVRTDGLTGIGLDKALTRFIAMAIAVLIPFLGVLALGWFLFDPLRQNIPDKVAKTYVVRVPKGLFSREVPLENEDQNI